VLLNSSYSGAVPL